ncbi:MAG: gliding motility-associated C-terminal domain-containing protein, partial [Flavobacteriales bacterium]
NISPDTSICLGDSIILRATSATNHIWTPRINILNDSSSNPTIFPSSSMSYYLNATTLGGCRGWDTVTVTVITPPIPSLSNDTTSCPHQPIVLSATGATNYVWQPPYKLSSTFGSAVTTSTDTSITYYVNFSNVCFSETDSVKVSVVNIQATSSPDDTICATDSAVLWAYGGDSYSWFPKANVAQHSNSVTKAKADVPTNFFVVVENSAGCKDTSFTKIHFYPKSFLNAGPDQVLVYGSSTYLNAVHSFGSFSWDAHYSLSCDTCPYTKVKPELATDYIANLIDTFGCKITDTVRILMDGSIYIPNSFTPNRDFKNEYFVISARDLIEFKIEIFNRWGELIYESEDIEKSWDGTYKGNDVPTGTYIWKLTYMDARLLRTTKYGHINLLR